MMPLTLFRMFNNGRPEHKEMPARETCYAPHKHTSAIDVKQGAKCGEHPKKLQKLQWGLFMAASLEYLIKIIQ